MALRVCMDCPRKIPAGARDSRCDTCRRAKDRARGTRQDRGYDADHDRLRAQWQQRMDTGEQVTCWRCAAAGRPHVVDPTNWHLGHDDLDRSQYRGPECPAGNLATSGRAALSQGRGVPHTRAVLEDRG